MIKWKAVMSAMRTKRTFVFVGATGACRQLSTSDQPHCKYDWRHQRDFREWCAFDWHLPYGGFRRIAAFPQSDVEQCFCRSKRVNRSLMVARLVFRRTGRAKLFDSSHILIT